MESTLNDVVCTCGMKFTTLQEWREHMSAWIRSNLLNRRIDALSATKYRLAIDTEGGGE